MFWTMMMGGGAGWASKLWSTFVSVAVFWAMCRQYFPAQFDHHFGKYASKLIGLVYPFIEIRFPEHVGERLRSNEAYTAIEAYLTATCTTTAKKLKAEMGKDKGTLDLSMDDYEEVTDMFRGVKLWWTSVYQVKRNTSFSFYPNPDEKRFYRLTFHRRHRDLVHGSYLKHVMDEGKAAGVRRRQRKLYTNNAPNENYGWYSDKVWSHVPFEHPSTFETLAMDMEKKQEIVEDLLAFTESKDYYARVGKAWKRGYLLYGPPGTGKSSMVAAIANLLDYDVYDLELTTVRSNTALRKLLIETTSKSVIVIEDIDCSLDLTNKRKKQKKQKDDGTSTDDKPPWDDKNKKSQVTLSGLLNFIDGLWSACGGERVLVFTTNHVDKLDPALIRTGRMDKMIELSYCTFEGFQVLAKNYLGVETAHKLFGKVKELIGEAQITPADVAEHLIPRSKKNRSRYIVDQEEITTVLVHLIEVLKKAKEKVVKPAEKISCSVEDEVSDE